MIPLGLALALQAAGVGVGVGVSDDASPPLLEAEAALRAGIHSACVEFARDAVKSGRLDTAPLARAWLVRGRCHVLAGDVDKAERAYAVAVRINPAIVLPTDDAVFARVRPEGLAEATALRLGATTVVLGNDAAPGAIVGIDVMVQDDLGLADRFELIDGDDREVAGAPVTGPVPVLARIHRLSGFPVSGLRARLLDKAGNRLRVVDVVIGDDVGRALELAGAVAPAGTSSEASAAVGTLAYVGAGVLAAGFATATITGISTAVAMQADESRIVDEELPLLLGFGAGVLAFVTGGALIAADRWPTATATTATTATATTTTTTTMTTTTAPLETAAPTTATNAPPATPTTALPTATGSTP